ncbi:MAG: chromosomal replication initiator protein DnaA [Candidatus Daviesbacteria bacterium]|nr:chromosomal replication initiator protein DnaA [Candidatus Daviesbacteria bacterium]
MDKFSTALKIPMDNLRLWHRFLSIIKPNTSSANFRTFFSQTFLKSIDNNKITLAAPSAFIKETLNQRHLPLIEDTFEKLLDKKVYIEFIVKEAAIEDKSQTEEDFFKPIQSPTSILNPKYTLSNYVVGPSNNVAYAAAQAIVQNPGTSYNPLFIYGGTGVGKTHLMLGIGNAILDKKAHAKIIYSSSERFMNDYVGAIQTHKMGDLRIKYRSPDVLLVDDIQFFSGREGTQEEFFHTFNELVGKNSQIVLTSDRPPHEIAKLEDRLKSRFAGGLMIDIQAPDFDTRVAILRSKCLEHEVILTEETLKLLAASFETNIRELEGQLVGILQLLQAQNLPLTNENISKHLQTRITSRQNIKIEPKKVLEVVCQYFNLNHKDLIGAKRQKELVLPRHLAMFILSEQLNLTVEKIGLLLGKRDHTTVMHGRDKIKKLVSHDREIQRILIEVKQKLQALSA